jgi:hypothetical protein
MAIISSTVAIGITRVVEAIALLHIVLVVSVYLWWFDTECVCSWLPLCCIWRLHVYTCYS